METEYGHLLMVADNQMNCEMLSRQLKQQGYLVTCAADGGQSLEMIAEQPFDLVLIDIRQPQIDRVLLLEQIKADKTLRHIPVIVLARMDDLAGVERFLAMGVEEYLREPFSPMLLKARIDGCLQKKWLLDQEHVQQELLKSAGRYERELQIGRDIQTSFLPDTLPQPPGWEIASYFHPAREVAGDFYDAFPLPHNRLGLVIGDVCDKGVGAALFMALFRSLIRAFAQQPHSLSLLDALSSDQPMSTRGSAGRRRQAPPSIGTQALQNAMVLTNKYIVRTHGATNMFATIFFGVLDPTTGVMIYINGGHEPPAIIGSAGVKARLKPTGPAVGILPDMDYEIQQAQFDPGDILIVYTDGVTEARNPDGKFFTEKNLLPLLKQPVSSAAALLDLIKARVHAHIADAVQFDDITMLAVRRTPIPRA
jgi:sigma-B regulation protein RsbU (phosphoserine phosphatase)